MKSDFPPPEICGSHIILTHANLCRAKEHIDCFKEIWPQAVRWLDYAYGSSAPPPDSILYANLSEWTDSWKNPDLQQGSMRHYHVMKTKEPTLCGLATVEVVELKPLISSMHYVIRPTEAGFGFATEAAQILSDTLLAHNETCEVIMTIEEDNIASRRVADKSGFVPSPEHTKYEINGMGNEVPFHGYIRRK